MDSLRTVEWVAFWGMLAVPLVTACWVPWFNARLRKARETFESDVASLEDAISVRGRIWPTSTYGNRWWFLFVGFMLGLDFALAARDEFNMTRPPISIAMLLMTLVEVCFIRSDRQETVLAVGRDGLNRIDIGGRATRIPWESYQRHRWTSGWRGSMKLHIVVSAGKSSRKVNLSIDIPRLDVSEETQRAIDEYIDQHVADAREMEHAPA